MKLSDDFKMEVKTIMDAICTHENGGLTFETASKIIKDLAAKPYNTALVDKAVKVGARLMPRTQAYLPLAPPTGSGLNRPSVGLDGPEPVFTILGIDPSLTATGLVLVDQYGAVLTQKVVGFSPHSRPPRGPPHAHSQHGKSPGP